MKSIPAVLTIIASLLILWLLGCNSPSAPAAHARMQKKHGEGKGALRAMDESPATWMMVCQPDTQFLSAGNLAGFRAQTAWIANQAHEKNIRHIFHLGDMVDDPLIPNQWASAKEAMSLLSPVLPTVAISLTIGNHDFDNRYHADSTVSKWASAFGHSYRKSYDWYRGSSNPDLIKDDRNHYCTFKAGGYEFLSMDLQWNPRTADLAWATRILEANPHMPTILGTHAYLNDVEGGDLKRGPGQNIWDLLIKQHPQIFLVVNGHASVQGSGSQLVVSKNKAGRPVIQMLADFQSEKGKASWFRLINFEMDRDRIHFQTYNPSSDTYIQGPRHDFHVDMHFAQRFAI